MPRKIKVLFPVDRSFDEVDKYKLEGGEVFSVSGYAYEHLSRSNKLQITFVNSADNSRSLKILRRFFGHEAINFFSQIKLIKLARDFDVIYYPADRHPYLLCLAKLLGALRAPVLLICHFSYNTRLVSSITKRLILALERRLVFSTMDKIFFLCQSLIDRATECADVPLRHQNNCYWGASLEYFKSPALNPPEVSGPFFFSSGSAMRDYKTLVEAFRELPCQLVISCPREQLTDCFPLPCNIIHYDFPSAGLEAFSAIKFFNQNCLAVLIPISHPNHVANAASSFVEALACGKPIYITDTGNPFLDVEEHAIGRKIQFHSVEDWRAKISLLLTSSSLLDEMGECSRRLSTIYNYERFSLIVEQSLLSIVND